MPKKVQWNICIFDGQYPYQKVVANSCKLFAKRYNSARSEPSFFVGGGITDFGSRFWLFSLVESTTFKMKKL